MIGGPPSPGLQIAGLTLVALALGCGQLLFKFAAERLVTGHGATRLLVSFVTAPFLAAVVVYALATLLWVYLLQGLALSRAYPFIALAFALVPLLAWGVLGEPLGARYWLGLTVMLLGLYILSTGL